MAPTGRRPAVTKPSALRANAHVDLPATAPDRALTHQRQSRRDAYHGKAGTLRAKDIVKPGKRPPKAGRVFPPDTHEVAVAGNHRSRLCSSLSVRRGTIGPRLRPSLWPDCSPGSGRREGLAHGWWHNDSAE
jgi:hypothetical protein